MTVGTAAALLACTAGAFALPACGRGHPGAAAGGAAPGPPRKAASRDRSLVQAPDPPGGPFEALVTAGGLTTRGYVESNCLRSPHGGSCVDALPPGPAAPVLPVKPRSFVGIRLGAPARVLTARVVRLGKGS